MSRTPTQQVSDASSQPSSNRPGRVHHPGTRRASGHLHPSRGAKRGTSNTSIVELLICLGLTGVVFAQAPFHIVIDTKLNLAISPVNFLANSIHLWDPYAYLGSVQNQAYGYLFPMGSFYSLGYILHLPAWITQRLWMSALLVTSFTGTMRLARKLGVGEETSRILSALAYALSPLTLQAGSASATILPIALLPWTLLPLVGLDEKLTSSSFPRKHSDDKGTFRQIVRATALSGIAVAFMGGVNATSTMAVLTMPGLWILTRPRDRHKWRVLLSWLIAVILATAWFAIALVFQGKYGFDFLPYTENARNTSAYVSTAETLRGGGVWLSYLLIHGIWDPAGWMIESVPVVIAAGSLVAAIGIYGLVRRDMPEGRFFAYTVAVGMFIIGLGYWGRFGSPIAHQDHLILSGPLAPFRNIDKFQPIIALSLALGLAHGSPKITSSLGQLARGQWGSRIARTSKPVATAVVSACILVAAAPVFSGKLYMSRSFSRIPNYWVQAANWLQHHAGHEATLVVPGTSFARFTWGTTNDDPIGSLTSIRWAVRNIAPLGGVGNNQILDAVDKVLAGGRAVPGLSEFLARAGIKYLLAVNDLDPQLTDAPPPAVVRAVLSRENGLRRVARFGPIIEDSNAGPGAIINYAPIGITHPLRALEIYEVTQPVHIVTTYPLKGGLLVTGGPQSLLPIGGAHLLKGRAVALAGDPLAPKLEDPTWVATDSQQRTSVNFGQLYDSSSYVLTAHQKSPNTGNPPRDWNVLHQHGQQTVAKLIGAKSIEASSYGAPISRIPGYGPVGAFIDHPETAAWAASGTNQQGAWIQIDFVRPILLSKVTITPLDDGPWRPEVTKVTLSTQVGKIVHAIDPRQIPQTVSLPRGYSKWLRVTLDKVVPPVQPGSGAGPGIKHISIPGLHVTEFLEVPDNAGKAVSSPTAPPPVYLFNDPSPNPFAYLSPPDPEPHMHRIFTVPHSGYFAVRATVTPRPGKTLLKYVSGEQNIKITASSVFHSLPLFRPQNLTDNSLLTSWLAGSSDPHPTLRYSWPGKHRLSSVFVGIDQAASRPAEMLISSPSGSRLIRIPPKGGVVHFKPLDTDEVTITFPKIAYMKSIDLLSGEPIDIPIGLSELDFPALSPLPRSYLNLNAPFHLSCGEGPPLVIDNHYYPTSVRGTIGDLFALSPMPLKVCEPQEKVYLHSGENSLVASDSGYGLKVTSVALEGSGSPLLTRASLLTGSPQPTRSQPTRSQPTRLLRILSWHRSNRILKIGGGSASIIALRQNFNKGWRATAYGRPLRSVRLDGWAQGFVLPAGKSTEVKSYFPPDINWFKEMLFVGLLLMASLFLAALWTTYKRSSNKKSSPPAMEPARNERDHHLSSPAPRSSANSNSLLTRNALQASDESQYVLSTKVKSSTRFFKGVILAASVYLLSGPLVLSLPLAFWMSKEKTTRNQRYALLGTNQFIVIKSARRRIHLSPATWAACCMIVAGLAISVHPATSSTAWFGPRSYTAQAFGMVAVAILVIGKWNLSKWDLSSNNSANNDYISKDNGLRHQQRLHGKKQR